MRSIIDHDKCKTHEQCPQCARYGRSFVDTRQTTRVSLDSHTTQVEPTRRPDRRTHALSEKQTYKRSSTAIISFIMMGRKHGHAAHPPTSHSTRPCKHRHRRPPLPAQTCTNDHTAPESTRSETTEGAQPIHAAANDHMHACVPARRRRPIEDMPPDAGSTHARRQADGAKLMARADGAR